MLIGEFKEPQATLLLEEIRDNAPNWRVVADFMRMGIKEALGTDYDGVEAGGVVNYLAYQFSNLENEDSDYDRIAKKSYWQGLMMGAIVKMEKSEDRSWVTGVPDSQRDSIRENAHEVLARAGISTELSEEDQIELAIYLGVDVEIFSDTSTPQEITDAFHHQ